MDEPATKNTDDHFRCAQPEIPASEQELENHGSAETDESEIEKALESRPIKKILFVDDEEDICKLFKEGLEKFGYEVTVASNGNEGINLFRENPADLIITDIFMPEKDGHTFILEVLQEFPETKIFAITGKETFMGLETELDLAKKLGAIRGFPKPVQLSELLGAIKNC